MEPAKLNNIQSYLSFKLDDELFALGVDDVIEILEVPEITRVPEAPEYMAGMINLRGKLLPVVDTRIKFGLSKIKFTLDTCVVILKIEFDKEEIQVGIVVDSVLEVMEISNNTMQSVPSIDRKYPLRYMNSIVRTDEQFIILLNIGGIFSLEEKETLKTNNT